MAGAFVTHIGRISAVGAPFAFAACIGAAVLAATGYNPVTVYGLMANEAFGGQRRIAATLTAGARPLETAAA